MMWRLAIFVMCFASPALPNVITVESGEHAAFSRLVLSLPTAQDWQLGRTETGYELAVGAVGQRYDISGVFDLIPKDRLTGIFVDPASGRLQLMLDCNCHAMPFSLDDRTIVIDLRDGPPPARSAFENGLEAGAFAPLRGDESPAVRPRLRARAEVPDQAYNWLAGPQPMLPGPSALVVPAQVDGGDDIRQALVAQLAEGAARGVVDLALPSATAIGNAPYLAEDVSVRLTGTPGLQIGGQPASEEFLQPDGDACLPEEQLDLASWGDPLAVYGQLAMLHTDLLNEFDKPQDEAVLRAARLYLVLGFGAEARNLLKAFAMDSDDARLLSDLARIIDAEPVGPAHAFSGMAACNTAAALWSFLAMPAAPPANANMEAIKRSFSALPAHLRRHLGPPLVDRLIALQEMETAYGISAAMGRGGGDDARASDLVQAELALATGETDIAIERAETVLDDAGQFGPQALITLIDAQIASGARVDPALAETAFAMIAEHEGHPLEPALQRSHLRALAGSGQFSAVFGLSPDMRPADPYVWSLLAKNGSDDDLLTFAFVPPEIGMTAQAAAQIADRLDALGFMAAADAWRDAPVEMWPASEGSAIVADVDQNGEVAAADLAQSDPQQDAGDVASDMAQNASRADRWAQNWPVIAAENGDTWGQLAQQLAAVEPAGPAAPLAAATALLEQSDATRALIDALLIETSGAEE